MGIGDPVIVTSRAADRGGVSATPRSGPGARTTSSGIETGDYDIGFVLADGLSPERWSTTAQGCCRHW